VKRQFRSGLYFQAAYTYSRALDDEQISSYWAPMGYDYGPTAGMNQQTFVFSHVYELPFGRGKKYLSSGLLSHIAGNWALNGIFVAKTGNWFGVAADASTLNAVSASNRPNVIGSVTYPKRAGSGAYWFSPAAFAAALPLQFGDAGKNILVGPGLINYDLSTFRNFKLTERWNMQFRGEFYNISNTPHFNNPGATLAISTFGIVTSSYGERRIQLGVKLEF